MFKKTSLTIKLIFWFLLISLTPIMIIGYMSFNSSEKSLNESALQGLENGSEALVQNIITYFDDQISLINTIASATTFEEQSDISAIQIELNKLLEKLPQFKTLSLLDKNGIVLASTESEEIGKDKSHDPYYLDGKDKPNLKEVYHSSIGEDVFAISAPVFSDDNGELRGVIVGRHNTDELNTILSSVNGNGETIKAHLVNSDGYIFTETRFEGKSAVLRQKGDSELVKRALSSGEDLTGDNVDYRNKEVLAIVDTDNFKKELGKAWASVVEIDKDEVNAPVLALRNRILFSVGIILFLVLALAVFVARSIAKPIIGAKNAAIEIARGNMDAEIDTSGKDEIAELSQAIAKMRDSLKVVFEEYEKKIK